MQSPKPTEHYQYFIALLPSNVNKATGKLLANGQEATVHRFGNMRTQVIKIFCSAAAHPREAARLNARMKFLLEEVAILRDAARFLCLPTFFAMGTVPYALFPRMTTDLFTVIDHPQRFFPGQSNFDIRNVLLNKAKDVYNTLSFLRAHNLIHGDLKPENFLYHVTTQRLLLADNAHMQGPRHKNNKAFAGTPIYNPVWLNTKERSKAESIPHEQKPIGDIFASGLIILAILTQDMPYSREQAINEARSTGKALVHYIINHDKNSPFQPLCPAMIKVLSLMTVLVGATMPTTQEMTSGFNKQSLQDYLFYNDDPQYPAPQRAAPKTSFLFGIRRRNLSEKSMHDRWRAKLPH